ncbi:hypothetical protein DFJ74DRAFT_697779 [Hyaloraphidium curvatum]|nr:hypothetical protein DFJ74DRAFT_697779 [Hyaloraphidium curvatum]
MSLREPSSPVCDHSRLPMARPCALPVWVRDATPTPEKEYERGCAFPAHPSPDHRGPARSDGLRTPPARDPAGRRGAARDRRGGAARLARRGPPEPVPPVRDARGAPRRRARRERRRPPRAPGHDGAVAVRGAVGQPHGHPRHHHRGADHHHARPRARHPAAGRLAAARDHAHPAGPGRVPPVRLQAAGRAQVLHRPRRRRLPVRRDRDADRRPGLRGRPVQPLPRRRPHGPHHRARRPELQLHQPHQRHLLRHDPHPRRQHLPRLRLGHGVVLRPLHHAQQLPRPRDRARQARGRHPRRLQLLHQRVGMPPAGHHGRRDGGVALVRAAEPGHPRVAQRPRAGVGHQRALGTVHEPHGVGLDLPGGPVERVCRRQAGRHLLGAAGRVLPLLAAAGGLPRVPQLQDGLGLVGHHHALLRRRPLALQQDHGVGARGPAPAPVRAHRQRRRPHGVLLRAAGGLPRGLRGREVPRDAAHQDRAAGAGDERVAGADRVRGGDGEEGRVDRGADGGDEDVFDVGGDADRGPEGAGEGGGCGGAAGGEGAEGVVQALVMAAGGGSGRRDGILMRFAVELWETYGAFDWSWGAFGVRAGSGQTTLWRRGFRRSATGRRQSGSRRPAVTQRR